MKLTGSGTHVEGPIILAGDLRERFLAEVESRLPTKSFGYFISTGDPHKPDDYLLFDGNIRNSTEWKGKFESYGQYFLDHDDAGFVATPEESWKMQKQIWARGMVAIGVFHSHLRHPANFSLIDYDMHRKSCDDLWHMIVSVRTREQVQVRAFSVEAWGVRELPVLGESAESGEVREAAGDTREVLGLDSTGRPAHPDSREIWEALCAARGTDDEAVAGFLRGSEDRYREHVAAVMRSLPGGTFQMGSEPETRAHYVGEQPRHEVALSPFSISSVAVTNRLMGLMKAKWLEVPDADLEKPAVGVTWYDAAVFARWMGCRLATEAEWEFACGAGSTGEWVCEEEELARFGWSSKNSAGEAHPVGQLEPNAFGLHDFHGNVWEWCYDGYHQDFYAESPGIDPQGSTLDNVDRVCRGGSFHALAEMCRTRYRFHDPPAFSAWDLGFRLARSA